MRGLRGPSPAVDWPQIENTPEEAVIYHPTHIANDQIPAPPRWATRRTNLIALAVAILATAVALAFAPTARAATPVSVAVGDSLQPALVTVPPGTTVVFRNTDDERHRMRPHVGPADFDTGNLEPGEAAAVVMNAEGTYQYGDHRNGHAHTPGYAGTIVVTSSATPPPAGGGGSPPPTDTAPPTTATVSLANDTFTSRAVTIAVGGTVIWTNNDGGAHTVTASDASFDSGLMAGGATFQRPFTAAGTYPYVCDLHSNMTGTVVVVATNGTPPPVTPPPTTPQATTPTPASAPASAAVSIANDLFAPTTVTVAAGGTVTWTNNDARLHNVAAGDSSWVSEIMAKSGGTHQRTFATPGTHAYICSLHPEMTGTVIVVDAAGNAPPPASSPPATQPPATTPAAATPPPATTPRSGGTPAALPMLAQVAMANDLFAPPTITVAVGGTVRWLNNDTRPHTVTAADKSVDSGIMAKGATYERTFPTAGTYPYVCDLHSNMTGTVIAATNPTAAAAAAASVAATPSRKKTPTTTTTTTTTTTKKTPAKAAGAAAPASSSVSMKGSVFTPKSVTIRPGGKVTWINDDSVVHTVTADDGSFDSGVIATGGRHEHTYAKAGTYGYKCSYHPGMEGTVVVATTTGSAGAAKATRTTAPVASARISTAAATAFPTPAASQAKGSRAINASVEMRDNLFAPANVTVPVGSTGTFTNTGKLPHTATAADKSFDSKIVAPGGKWSTTFTKTGTFKYDCIIHPGMTGSVTVTEADASQVVAVADGGQAGGPPSNSAAGALPTSNQAPSAAGGPTETNGATSYRGVALLVSGLVIAAGALYLLGMLIVQDPRWRKAAVRTIRGAVATWRAVTPTWFTRSTRVPST